MITISKSRIMGLCALMGVMSCQSVDKSIGGGTREIQISADIRHSEHDETTLTPISRLSIDGVWFHGLQQHQALQNHARECR